MGKSFDIDIGAISKNVDGLRNQEVESFVAENIGRSNLGHLDKEWWIDFFIGASLWGVTAGVIRVV